MALKKEKRDKSSTFYDWLKFMNAITLAIYQELFINQLVVKERGL